MRIYKTEAIIIKRMNLGEADRLITLFSKEYGKIKVLAKGVRKARSRRSGHLEVFGQAQFSLYEGKTFDYVTEVVRKQVFHMPSDSLVRLSYAYYMCELIDVLLPERQVHADVYELFLDVCVSLSQTIDPHTCDSLTTNTTLQLLKTLGFLSEQKVLPQDSIHTFIESLTERRLKTPKFIQTVAHMNDSISLNSGVYS